MSNTLESAGPIALPDAGEPEAVVSPITLLRDIIIRPRAAFTALREAEKAYWWFVFLITLLAITLLALASWRIQSASLGTFTPPEGFEAPEGATLQSARSLGPMLLVTLVPLPVVLGAARVILAYLLGAFVVFGMSFVLGGKITFKQGFRLMVWSTLPLAIRRLVQAVVSLVTARMVAPGLSAVLTLRESFSLPLLTAILQHIDVYLIWSAVLLGIGTAVTARLSRGKAIAVVLTYLLIAGGIILGFAALSGFVAGLFGVSGGPVGGPGPARVIR